MSGIDSIETRRRHGRARRLLLAMLMLVAAPLAVGSAGAAQADDSEVTVPAPAGGFVTVEKTENLINEVIRVSWEGFTPSENPGGATGLFSDLFTRFPVRVYECRGPNPASAEECYGSQIYTYPGRSDPSPNEFLGHPDGPFNYLQRSTAPDGSGAVDIEVMTKRESTTLGCTEDTDCSIVVVPNYGLEDAQDPYYPQFPACATIYNGGDDPNCTIVSGNNIDAPWAWKNHVAIPISFAPSGDTCGLGDAAVAILGSPKAERALTSWQAAACVGASAVDFDYTAQGEELSRNAFLNGQTDVALTVEPVDPAAISDDTRPFTYAPIAASSVVVAFRVDDWATGLPITSMRLNPRLIAKLVTQSYGYFSWSTEDSDTGNPATRGNPATLFTDPEFLALNPDINWPAMFGFGVDSLCSTPLLLADRSDMTYELTRYLAADPDAAAFLSGEEDEWGTTINTNFADMTPYPVNFFELRDPDEKITKEFQPIQGLNAVARRLVGNTYAGTTNTVVPGNPPTYEKCNAGKGYQAPGSRSFVAIVDSGNAGAFRFPTAELLNAAGEYVGPTIDAMAAAVDDMTLNADGITRSPDVDSSDPKAYPLTLVDYAMVPTAGLDADTAEGVGRVLDYAATAGQQTDQLYGGLPVGFLPLNATLSSQTTAAAAAARAQDGGPKPTSSPTPTPTPSTPATTGGGSGVITPAAAGGGAAPILGVVPQATAPAVGGSPSAAVVEPGSFVPIASKSPAFLGSLLPVILVAGLAAAGLGALSSWLLGRGGTVVSRMPWQRRSRRRPMSGAR